jgi:microsomal prostaglandin-E synthase 2|tara:strand:+ start:509 stop:1222 length:714 start_codon:yes stop_codon:yes gene_type:complete
MGSTVGQAMAKVTLHMLHTCPFCWKVRGLIEYLKLDVDYVSVNGLKIKKAVSFAGDWGKVPVFTDESGQYHTDSTPIMKFIDENYNAGKLQSSDDDSRMAQWLEWADTKMSKATVPILYGTLGSAFQTTTRISKIEKFGFISKRLYAWAGFPIMWGIIAKKRVKKDGRKPKQLWHDLLTEFTQEHRGEDYFGGSEPNIVDFSVFGYMRSISPFPQFSLLTDHTDAMAWYNRMELLVA